MWSWSSSNKPPVPAARALALAALGPLFLAACLTGGGGSPSRSVLKPGQARWKKISAFGPLSEYADLGRATFFTAQRGLALSGPPGRIVLNLTLDGGANWQAQNLDSAWRLESVAAVDSASGFLAFSLAPDSAGISHYGVLHTLDAGATWNRMAFAGDSDLALFYAGKSPLALVDRDPMGNVDFLLSEDGGSIWRPWSPASHPFAPKNLLTTRPIHAYSAGKALAGSVALNWIDLSTGAVSRYRNFPDTVSGPEIGPALAGQEWIAFGGFAIRDTLNWPFLVQSRDGGKAWDTLAATRSARMRGIRLDGANGLAYGESVDPGIGDTSSALWITWDGGATWSESFTDATETPIEETVWAAPGICYGFSRAAVYRLEF